MSKKVKASAKRPVILWAVMAVVALLMGYRLYEKNGDTAVASESHTLPPATPTANDEAPAFSLPDLSGHTVSLSDFGGKVVILDFWATWCPPCKREIPDFISLQNEYGPKGLQVVGVALDEADKVRAFAKANGMNYPVAIGNDNVAAAYGGISGIPTTYVLNRQGRIVARFEGYRPRDVFEQEIRKLF
jgi:peroxiredoxin